MGLDRLENAEASWLVGWSRGREMLKDGVYDRQKGSYYINCTFYKVDTIVIIIYPHLIHLDPFFYFIFLTEWPG